MDNVIGKCVLSRLSLGQAVVGQRFKLKFDQNFVRVTFGGSEIRDGVLKYKFTCEMCPSFSFFFTEIEFNNRVLKESGVLS